MTHVVFYRTGYGRPLLSATFPTGVRAFAFAEEALLSPGYIVESIEAVVG